MDGFKKAGSKAFFFGHAEGVLLARQKKQKTFIHLAQCPYNREANG